MKILNFGSSKSIAKNRSKLFLPDTMENDILTEAKIFIQKNFMIPCQGTLGHLFFSGNRMVRIWAWWQEFSHFPFDIPLWKFKIAIRFITIVPKSRSRRYCRSISKYSWPMFKDQTKDNSKYSQFCWIIHLENWNQPNSA